MSAVGLLNEADLHGLVDGHIEASRRAEVLRKLASSPADRARVEAWQDQNDLIKSAFFGVTKEPLPVTLRLVAPPALHCVPAAEPALIERAQQAPAPTQRSGMFAALAVLLMFTGGIAGAWVLLQSSETPLQVVDVQLRGTVDEALASQAAGAIAADTIGRSVKDAGRPSATATPLPTTSIPDLTSAGFTLTSAETAAIEPTALVFHYRNAADERVAISVARTTETPSNAGPTKVGRSFSWHRGRQAFAIAGTVRPERLRAMVAQLQNARLDR